MAQARETEFKCKEPDCPETVTYRRQIVTGVVQLLPDEESNKQQRRRVYLTCAKQHVHAYEL